jgi:diacylglycerol kinase (ATP)
MRVTIVHNPNAGGAGRADSLVAELTAARYQVSYANVKKVPLDEVLEDPGDLVIAAGGDGTVRKVASRLIGRGVPMVVVPLGTANNIAATLGVHDRPNHLAEYLQTLVPMPFDVGFWSHSNEETPFLESVGVGLLTNLMAELSDRKKHERVQDKERGFAEELEALHKLVEKAVAFKVEIEADGEDLSGDYLLIEVMNIRSVGPNVALAPMANPSDGLFDLVLVKEAERQLLDSFMEATRRRKPAPELTRRRVRSVKAKCIGGQVHMDDQRMDDRSSVFAAKIQAGALTMLVPAPAETHGRRVADRRAPLRPQ